MALMDFTIPNLFNGVSQQPTTIRLPNQCKEQINGNARVTDGLSKRTPLLYNKIEQLKVSDVPQSFTDLDTKMHMMRGKDANGLDTTVQIIVRCSTGRMWATYMSGALVGTTKDLGVNAYLVGSNKKSIKFLTNGDTTYVLNKNQTVATLGIADSDIDTTKQGTLIYIQQGFFGTTYQVTIKTVDKTTGAAIQTVNASFSTPSSTVADVSSLQTNSIAGSLFTAIETAITTAGGDIDTKTTRTNSKNWIQIAINDNTFAATRRIEVEAFSSTSRQAIYAFNGNAIDYITLPPTAPEGYTVKIQSDASTTKDDYYLKYQGKNSGWLESKQLGLNDQVDNTTMPIQITNLLADPDNILVTHIPIKAREVGDKESVPEPSFVGKTLNDIFIFSNRLGFLSGNNVIMSKIDEYDVYYRTTVATSLAADRVDLQASVPSVRYSELNFSIPFDKEIIMFGDSAQYSLSANTGFDVKTASLATLTEYESSKDCTPVNIGASIYFPITRGSYTGIFDLSRKDGIGLTAEEATQHVPVYMAGSVIEMVNSTTENMLFCRTDASKRLIYVQNRFIRQAVTEQNSWHKWLLPNDIVGIYNIGSDLYVTMISESGTELIRTVIDISLTLITETEETEITFTPYIDYNKLMPIASVISDSDVDADYYVLPEHVDSIIGVDIKGFIFRGVDKINETLETKALWVGVPYEFLYVFSEQTAAQYGQNGKTVMQYSRLMLKSMKIAYTNTGRFDIIIKPVGRESFITRFTGNILGLASSVLGRINIYSGVFKFPVNNRADSVDITISSSYPYPVTFNTVEWQAVFTQNSGRF